MSRLILAGLAVLPLFAMTPAGSAQSPDPEITSDTLQYCGILMDRISGLTRDAQGPQPTEVTALEEEGQKMCVHGQTRGGIMRLRRAIAILRHAED